MALGMRPLSTGQVLDRSFQIYRSNFMLFAGISALPNGTVLVMQLALLGAMFTTKGDPMIFAAISGIIGLLFVFVSLVFSSIATAATTFGVSDIYLEKPTSLGSCFSRVKGKIWRVAITSLEFGLRIGLGFLLLIIPGIYFAGKWGLVIPAVVLEDSDRKKAFPRAAQLSADSVGRVIVVYFLTWILLMAISMGIGAVLAMIAPGLTRAAGTVTSQVVQYVISAVVNTVVTPVMAISLTVLYYDQRVRKEGFDIENLLKMLGESSAKHAAAATSATN